MANIKNYEQAPGGELAHQDIIRLLAQHFNNQQQHQHQPNNYYQAQQPQMLANSNLFNFQSPLAPLAQYHQDQLQQQHRQQQQHASSSGPAQGIADPSAAAAAVAHANMNFFNALYCFNMTNDQFLLSLQQQYLLQAAASNARQLEARQPNLPAANLNRTGCAALEPQEHIHQVQGRRNHGSSATKFTSNRIQNESLVGRGAPEAPSDPPSVESPGGGGEFLKFSISTILGRRSPTTRANTLSSHNEGGLKSSSSASKSSSINQFSSLTGTPKPASLEHCTDPHYHQGISASGTSNKSKNNKQQQAANSASRPSSIFDKLKGDNTSDDLNASGCSTALSSLSNFVTNSLAPIFGDDLLPPRQRSSTSHKSGGSGQKRHPSSGGSISNNNNNISEDESQDEEKHSVARREPKSPMGILEAVSSALKGASGGGGPTAAPPPPPPPHTTNPTVATTINTTLAKAPPELVQKQPAWVFCTRYSDRPSSGPRTRRAKSKDKKPKDTSKLSADEKRPRTAFTSEQLEKLRQEFQANSYLDEKRRKSLAERLCLNENQIKIWFQNKRAKMKKQSQPNPLRGLLVAGGLYNHSTATSDCSESYANGLADDVGNRAMRDVEPDDEEDQGDQGDAATADSGVNSNNDRFNKSQIANSRKLNVSDHSSRSLDEDQHGDNNDKREFVAAAAAAASLKRRRTSQSDGDDENEDVGSNFSNPTHSAGATNLIKRTKLNHMERNNNHTNTNLHQQGPSPSPSSPQMQSPVLVADDGQDECQRHAASEHVTSVI